MLPPTLPLKPLLIIFREELGMLLPAKLYGERMARVLSQVPVGLPWLLSQRSDILVMSLDKYNTLYQQQSWPELQASRHQPSSCCQPSLVVGRWVGRQGGEGRGWIS